MHRRRRDTRRFIRPNWLLLSTKCLLEEGVLDEWSGELRESLKEEDSMRI